VIVGKIIGNGKYGICSSVVNVRLQNSIDVREEREKEAKTVCNDIASTTKLGNISRTNFATRYSRKVIASKIIGNG
jgi:hypothetical protein